MSSEGVRPQGLRNSMPEFWAEMDGELDMDMDGDMGGDVESVTVTALASTPHLGRPYLSPVWLHGSRGPSRPPPRSSLCSSQVGGFKDGQTWAKGG